MESVLWFLAIYGIVTAVLILVTLPEIHTTRGDIGTERVVERRGWKLCKILLLDPLKTILHLRRPVILLTSYYASITSCFLFMLKISIKHTFQRDPYRFSTIITGLLYHQIR
jgi:hypothetical protein